MIKMIISSFLILLFIGGCGGSDSTSVTIQAPKAGAYIVFDSENSNIPYPNDILFADGTLNIPYEEGDSDASVKFALNALDGFSTTSPISIGFDGEIDPKSLYGNIHLYELGTTGVTRELKFHVPNVVVGEYVATTSGNKIVILPVKPLDSGKNYGVVLTKGIVDTANNPIAPDVASEMLLSVTPLVKNGVNLTKLDYEAAVKLEGVRQLSQIVINASLAFDTTLKRADIVSGWRFKTQSIGKVFSAIKAANLSGVLTVASADMNTSSIGGFGKADIWIGTMSNLPYYLGTPSSSNPTAPLTSYFTDANGNAVFTGMPKLNSNKTVPILMTKPNAASKAVINGAVAPWPIVIFQHGIYQNRTNVLAIADALADAGYATIAMDLPLHGLDNNATGLMTTYERTFNIDYVKQGTNGGIISKGSDGIIDTSGRHYINFASLLTSRDNIRQSASDLLALKNAISGLNDINASRIAFVGHSLGTIASFGFLSTTHMESVTFAMPGGGIAELLNNSPEFASEIEAGLAAEGVMKGSSDYAAFMLATQTVLDDADPINYAMVVGATQNVFSIEVVGNGTEGTSDQVIPNSVATAPLSGTEPLLIYMQSANLTDTASVKPNQAARFTVGGHSSILRPDIATAEMQKETASFVGSRGTAVIVTDKSLLCNP